MPFRKVATFFLQGLMSSFPLGCLGTFCEEIKAVLHVRDDRIGLAVATMAGDSSPLGSGSKGGRELRSCSGTSGERLDRSSLVFLDIEHAVQFGGFQQIEDVDRRLQQLDVGSLIARSRQRTNELPDARTVDVRHACKVE
jgi:hypothetical protein